MVTPSPVAAPPAGAARRLGAGPCHHCWATRFPIGAAAIALAPALAFGLAALRDLHPWAPTVPQLLQAGASWGPRTLAGEPWRLATAAVCHAGVRHLVSNVVVLALAGAAVERLLGRAALVLGFVAAALIGAAASTVANPVTVIAGASSGALGLAALLAITAARRGRDLPRWQRRAIAGGLIALVGYHAVLALTRDDVDVIGHGAGALTGLALGLLAGRARWRAIGAAAAAAALVILVVAAGPAPGDPYAVPRRVIAIEARYDALVGPPDRPTVRDEALARALEGEVAAPLEALAAGVTGDASLPPRLAVAIARMRAYAGARAAIVRLFVRYLRAPDPTLLREIEARTAEADRLLERE